MTKFEEPSGSVRKAGLALVALLTGLGAYHSVRAEEASPATGATMNVTVGGVGWMSYANRLDGQRYSTLSEINTKNAAKLGEACRVGIDGPTSSRPA